MSLEIYGVSFKIENENYKRNKIMKENVKARLEKRLKYQTKLKAWLAQVLELKDYCERELADVDIDIRAAEESEEQKIADGKRETRA